MELVIPDSARRLVASCFGEATYRRAVDYAQGGRVHLVKPPPWPVVAKVRGTHGYVVTVSFESGSRHLRGDCSCPVGVDCKHAAATALVVLAAERGQVTRWRDAARQEVVGSWLASLGAPPARPPAAPSPDGPTVAYVLDDRGGEVGLAVVRCTRLKAGGLGATSALAAPGDSSREPPSWIELDDLRRIALVRAVTRASGHATRLPVDHLHGELIEDLAASGRLFWASTRGAPLAWGPPRTDALTWLAQPDEPETRRLGLAAGLAIVAARECHYVDAAAAVIGPLALGVPAELVRRLIAGPAVPAAMQDTVDRSLAALLSPPGAPTATAATTALTAATAATSVTSPPTAPPTAIPTATPTASALADFRPRLFASLASEGRAARRERRLALTTEAVYGDEHLPLAVWDPDRPLVRDLVAEGRALARLDALRLALPHGGARVGPVEVLADARVVAERIVPTLRAEGWDCELSDDFPCAAPAVVDYVEDLRPIGDGHGWFALELGVAIAGRTVPLLPILLQAIREGQLSLDLAGEAADAGTGINLRLPEGELIHVPAERVRRWLRPLVELELAGLERGTLRLPTLVAAAIAEDAPGRFAASAALDGARARLAALIDLAPRHEEPSFVGALRPYQRIGLAWLRFLHDAGYGGVLADEMGLGKTVQLLAFLDGLGQAGQLTATAPALVVAPRSVVGNWAHEAARFAPGLGARIHLGGGRAQRVAELRGAHLIVTSYQTLLRDAALLTEITWTTVIFDEAQVIKNPATKLRAAAAGLGATSRFCVTGTPIENHLGELWSQVDLAMPGLVGRRRSFDAIFRRPIEKHGAAAPLEHLRRRIRPFLLRRTKDRVELELPAKTEIVERIELDTAQRDLYESLRLRLDGEVRAALAQRGLSGSSLVILDALLKLRQCCCDPRLVKLPEARRVTGSAKLERLIAMLEELGDSGRATLVFSQFTSMLELIEQACRRAGIATLTLTGATRDREAVIRRFQAGEAPVFLISLKAGGVGLNLTRADTVVHYDPWWNPAVEAQATDRAHRIGQDKHVMVYKLVARGTLEETICELQDHKRELGAAALRDGGVTHLGADDLGALFHRLV